MSPAWSPSAKAHLRRIRRAALGINFRNYDPSGSSPTDASGTVTLSCTGVVSLLGTIDVASSTGTSSDPNARQMAQAATRLNYNLYIDSSRNAVWGTGANGTNIISAPLNGLLVFNQSVTVYGRIPGRQWVNSGVYADNVIVTITY